MEQWMQLQDFWDGLNPSSRRLLNSAVVGPLMKKTPEEIVTFLNELSEDTEHRSTDQEDRRRSVGVHQVESSVAMQAQIAALAKDIKQLIIAQIAEEQKIGKSLPKEDISSKEVDKQKLSSTVEESKHMLLLPFPQKMKREKLDKCFVKFLDMLKYLYVNIPFTEVLTQMPAYAKFLKKLLSSKRKLEEMKVVKLNGHCSAILQNKISKKCGDLGSITIPCSLGRENFDKALCDSGASIKLIPLSVFKKLEGELGVIKSVSASLQLADQTMIIPEGILEDIMVRVNKFIFPVDFIIVDMEVNKQVPLILGRPFISTGRATLDIYEGKLMLGVGYKKVVFQMKRMMKYPCDEASAYACLKLDVVGELDEQHKLDKLVGDSLERCISQSSTTEDKDPEIKKEVEALEDENQVVGEEEFEKEMIKPKLELKEHMLVELLQKHKKAIGWSIADI
uniref:Aspartic peptidase DDI1-type domain-containing protein n=1 Tax=Nicotiana tabacum TaxID=4097 RepID=A0A1S4DAM6_TOBAC|nr:PREDICTED: uncharacterized protein LOC107827778 [Nicotiana tabacum]